MRKSSPPAVEPAIALLGELRELERLSLCGALRRRDQIVDSTHAALRALDDGPASSLVLERAPGELGRRSQYQRVVLSSVRGDRLTDFHLWRAGPPDETDRWPDLEVALRYPLIEAEILGDGQARLVRVGDSVGRTPGVLLERLGWREYFCVSVPARSTNRGWLLHVEPRVDLLETEAHLRALTRFAKGLGRGLELAQMRMLHRSFRDEQIRVAHAIIARIEATGITALVAPGEPEDGGDRDDLTPREHQVIGLLTKGMTNAAIAEHLLVSEGTVKYHVANVLRKVGATSRADAVARYMREQMRDGSA